ncbi:YdeI/OmpD-associated family protein [Flavobacterium rhizosphaerae]|uniref:YdeI/OmpD-associated family protein n=1 Tax=Flavobacterium rhizosphaerae TaxID=3163298 RepID=A0ABW8Z2E2_9FLAO
MEPQFFETPADFRKWLQQHYTDKQEVMVGFYKKSLGKSSITWPESVEQALCFGWIDGVRRSYNNEAYTIRFTPRKPNSTWSAVNIAKIQELQEKGLLQPAGLAAFQKRTEKNSKIYAHEQDEVATLPKALEEQFKANKAAWKFFEAQPPYYKKIMLHRVASAKQEKTQLQRLEKLMAACLEGKRLR